MLVSSLFERAVSRHLFALHVAFLGAPFVILIRFETTSSGVKERK